MTSGAPQPDDDPTQRIGAPGEIPFDGWHVRRKPRREPDPYKSDWHDRAEVLNPSAYDRGALPGGNSRSGGGRSDDGCCGGGCSGGGCLGNVLITTLLLGLLSLLARSAPARPARRRPSVPARAGTAAIHGYRRWLSPRRPASCRHTPTCSAYGLTAVTRYGLVTGTRLTADRLRRCAPATPRGTHDPVP